MLIQFAPICIQSYHSMIAVICSMPHQLTPLDHMFPSSDFAEIELNEKVQLPTRKGFELPIGK